MPLIVMCMKIRRGVVEIILIVRWDCAAVLR